MTERRRPILASSCARAATAAEARYRIDAEIASAGSVVVIALDGVAREVMHRVAGRPWQDARFFVAEPGRAGGAAEAEPSRLIMLRPLSGGASTVEDVVRSAASVVLLAGDTGSAPGAAAVGRACATHGVPTAGFIVGTRDGGTEPARALRPYAGVLLEGAAEDDVVSVLSALRA